MKVFNMGEHFALKKKFKTKEHEIEGIIIPLKVLTDELIEQSKSCVTYDEMILAAATFGLAYDIKSGGERIYGDEDSAEELELIWGNEQLSHIDCEPSLQHKVGEKVCAISGMTKYAEDRKQEEIEEAAINAEIAETEAREAKEKEAQAFVDAMQEDATIIDGDKKLPDISLGELDQAKSDAIEYAVESVA